MCDLLLAFHVVRCAFHPSCYVPAESSMTSVSCNGHLGCFHVLTIINRTTLNIFDRSWCTQISPQWPSILTSPGNIRWVHNSIQNPMKTQPQPSVPCSVHAILSSLLRTAASQNPGTVHAKSDPGFSILPLL